VDDPQLAWPVPDQAGDRVDVGRGDLLAEHRHAVILEADGARRADRLDGRLDLGVGRRGDLRAVVGVDLVAVVLRRVV
jgi:hypothetical protein